LLIWLFKWVNTNSSRCCCFGIKKALESLNPFVAIAAGVALIAVGTIAKSAK
jgi:hypothetical protein